MVSRHRFMLLAVLAFALVAFGGGVSSAKVHHKHHKHHKQHRKHRSHKRSSVLPRQGRIPGPSIFGIDTETQDTNHAYYVRDIPAARQLGARFTHITLGQGTGTGNFAAPDYEVTQARKHGMGVVLSFGGVASACSISTADYHACPPTTSADLTNYEAYIRKMLVRYHNVVQYYESWTEPNNKSSWLGGPNPALYATVLKAQYSVVQSINSEYHTDLKLLFGSPIGFQVNGNPGWTAVLPFTDEVLNDLNGATAFDGVALHAYRLPKDVNSGAVGPDGEVCDYLGGVRVAEGYSSDDCGGADWRWLTWSQELTAYDQLFAAHGYGTEPLWLTEFGWNGSAQPSGDVLSYQTQATYLQQAYSDLLSLPFVQAAMWFNVRDYQPGLASPDPKYFYHYGLLNYGFSRKPAGAEFKSLAAANPGR
jgi:hypothetical protein